MIYFKYILFLIILAITFGSNISDSSVISKDTVDKKAVLIPTYNANSEFKFEYLGKSRKIFYYSNISYINDNNAINLSVSPFFNYKKFKLKIDLEYFINLEESNLLTNDWSFIGIIEKIDYL